MLRPCKEVGLYIRSVLRTPARCQITFEPSPHSCHDVATVGPPVESTPSPFYIQIFTLLAWDAAAETKVFTMSGNKEDKCLQVAYCWPTGDTCRKASRTTCQHLGRFIPTPVLISLSPFIPKQSEYPRPDHLTTQVLDSSGVEHEWSREKEFSWVV